MIIELYNVATKLQVLNIDLNEGSGVDALTSNLQTISTIYSWGYSFSEDKLTIEVPDGTVIEDFLQFGEVYEG